MNDNDTCPKCGTGIGEGDRYCSDCGTALTELAEYESRPEVLKAADAMESLTVAVLCLLPRIGFVLAAIGAIAGVATWDAAAVMLLLSIASYGLQKWHERKVEATTPDEKLAEWGWNQ